MALYIKAAEILEKAQRKQGALKTLVYDSKFGNIKQLFALVCETQKFSSVLEEVIETTKLLKQTKLKMHMAKVLEFYCELVLLFRIGFMIIVIVRHT